MIKDTPVPKKIKKQQTKQKATPLIIEPHPKDYSGYPFITLIQYRQQHILAIVDNADNDAIKAFVLDLCGPERVDEELVISVASDWYEQSRTKYPLSFEFSKRGLSDHMTKIYKSFNIEFISRVIGPMPKFEMNKVISTKRRRRKSIPAGVRITRKVIAI